MASYVYLFVLYYREHLTSFNCYSDANVVAYLVRHLHIAIWLHKHSYLDEVTLAISSVNIKQLYHQHY